MSGIMHMMLKTNAVAPTAYKFWQQGAANNGRPYWDLASTSSGNLPTGSLVASASDWGFMVDIGASQSWNTITFTFGESHTAQGYEAVVSNVSTGACYVTGNTQPTGTTVVFTRTSLTWQGTVGSGGPGSVPSTARYFGFGEGDTGETFTITGITIT